MGSSSPSEFRDLQYSPDVSPEPEPVWVPPRRPARAPEPRTRYVILFILTVVSTTLVGANHYAGFFLDYGNGPVGLTTTQLLVRGLWYSASILAILGAHEFGHYFACRYYRVDASIP